MIRELKRFIKWWKSFEVRIEEPNDPDGWHPKAKPFEDEGTDKSWCPFCGYSGTGDNLRCHLLNDHRQ